GMGALVVGAFLLVWDWVWFAIGGVDQYFLGYSHLVISLWAVVISVIGLKRIVGVPVWLGVAPSVPLVPEKDVSITLPRAARAGLRVALTYDQPVSAPLAKGQALGKATLTAPGMDPMEVTLIAGEAVDQLNVLARFMAKLRLLFGKS
ncbi:MAG: hypothetical protein HGA90_03225, partial [Alphaproteobacteria bacterium]|nr:hypothetical protein [Alphaproteobacteria bacterium]